MYSISGCHQPLWAHGELAWSLLAQGHVPGVYVPKGHAGSWEVPGRAGAEIRGGRAQCTLPPALGSATGLHWDSPHCWASPPTP